MKKECTLQGLNCAHCASKIENKISKIEGMKSANLNFALKKLTFEIYDEKYENDIENHIKNIVNKIEPDVNLMFKKDNNSNITTTNDNRNKIIRFILGFIFFSVSIIFDFSNNIEFILYSISYILIGGDVLLRAFKNIIRGEIFDENFLMCIATLGAFFIRQYEEGIAVMLFYQVGEFIQGIAVNNSRKSITELMDIKPEYANLKLGNEFKKVSPEEIKMGDIILIKPGEKVPLDGKIIEGKSTLDTKALTGESLPKRVGEGDEILSGSINNEGLLLIKVIRNYKESTVTKILDLVQNASNRKAKTEKFITKFAKYYTPIVVIMAILLAIVPSFILQSEDFSQGLYKALVFLVVSCPCALVISIPLGFFGGIGGASKKGILIKGSNYLEALYDVNTVVFDKTGTLTKGVFKVTDIVSKNKYTENQLLQYAAYAESYSNHPIAISIINAYNKKIDKTRLTEYNEIAGYGIKTKIDNKEILVGNSKLMKNEDINTDDIDEIGTIVYISIDKEYAGYFIIRDEIKEDSKETINSLENMGIENIIMLTGDNYIIAKEIANELKIDEYYAELLPNDKYNKIEELEAKKENHKKILFVGDGINDAPVIARTDIGIAMGALGSDAAIEASDIVIMNDNISNIVTSIKIAKKTRKIVLQNIIFSLGIKFIVLILGAFGIATMWEAVFADVGVTIIAIINSMRTLNIKNIDKLK